MRRRRRLREAAYRDQTLLPPGKHSKASHSSSAQLSSTDGSSPYCTDKSLACHEKGDMAVMPTAIVSNQVTKDSLLTDWSERSSEQTVTGTGLAVLLTTCSDDALPVHCSDCMPWLSGSYGAVCVPELHMHRGSQCSGRASAHLLRLQTWSLAALRLLRFCCHLAHLEQSTDYLCCSTFVQCNGCLL